MRINTNGWNRLRYTLYAPVYDSVGRYFAHSRKKSIESLDIVPGDNILIIGAGTGLDLEYLPHGCHILATDLTPAMVERIRKRNDRLQLSLEARVMDGQQLQLPDHSFDKVILHLILAVIPDPLACIGEAHRVLKTRGTVAIFDKFVRPGHTTSLRRRLANPFINLIATNITRRAEAIIDPVLWETCSDEPAEWNGNFRRILLRKKES
ncbi:MAG: class I SAM-dependent methyltransferase [Marinilabiliales bacterium]|nr:class I SAM-dependent methyltransferase [Marinilabiliales bacterium]